MAGYEIPDKSAYHIRFATRADASSIVAAESNCNGDRIYSRLMNKSAPSNTPPTPVPEGVSPKVPKPQTEIDTSNTDSDSDFQYFYTRFSNPQYQYMVIGYFRDPALRPKPGADGSIPQIAVPDEETIKSGKEHIVGFAQWEYILGRSSEAWEEAHQKAIKARPPWLNHALVDATVDGRWEQRKVINGDKDYWCEKTHDKFDVTDDFSAE
jgi:hypothetical protein